MRRVGSTPLSLTILETTKFVRPAYITQLVLPCSRTDLLACEICIKAGMEIAVDFEISPQDCFCCKPTTVSQGKFPEISEILVRAVLLLDER